MQSKIESIVCMINETLASKLNVAHAKYFGLAEYMQSVLESDVTQKVPGIISNTGELECCGFDDVDALKCYHRIAQPITYALDSSQKRGDSRGDDVRTVFVSLIIMGDRTRLKCKPDYLESAFSTSMPQSLSKIQGESLGIFNCKITKVSSNLDTYQVFQSEYGIIDPDSHRLMFIELKYKIEYTQRTGCEINCFPNN